ncbi:hypothetical protein [Azospirillum sp. A29]|uniref:hypothetical protein n=1 Tax=unclassified Azospirillum TaxID=2630922 RepID=UPI00366B1E27
MTDQQLKYVPADILQRVTTVLREQADRPSAGFTYSGPGAKRTDLETLEAILANNTPRRLAIVLDGGLVQAVVGENLPGNLGVAIIDYDTEGADDVDLARIRQSDGSDAEAIVTLSAIDPPGIDLNSVFSSVT